ATSGALPDRPERRGTPRRNGGTPPPHRPATPLPPGTHPGYGRGASLDRTRRGVYPATLVHPPRVRARPSHPVPLPVVRPLLRTPPPPPTPPTSSSRSPAPARTRRRVRSPAAPPGRGPS